MSDDTFRTWLDQIIRPYRAYQEVFGGLVHLEGGPQDGGHAPQSSIPNGYRLADKPCEGCGRPVYVWHLLPGKDGTPK